MIFRPGRIRPRRSGSSALTPESIRATVTPFPLLRGHTFSWMSQVPNHHSSGRGSRIALAQEVDVDEASSIDAATAMTRFVNIDDALGLVSEHCLLLSLS